MDIAGFEQALTTATGAVFTGIRQHHALPQGCDQDVFPFSDHEGFSVTGDRDLKFLHAILHSRQDIFTDYTLL
jgi:hypothetical protein